MLRTIVCLLALAGCTAADPWRDPLADLSHTRALQTLWALRGPLASAPDDQRLLGIAIEAHVNLCLVGDRSVDASCGPWLVRAMALAERRRLARGGKPCASLAEAAPELWVLLLEGRTRAAVDAMAAWPNEADTPVGRALRVQATRDWRIVEHRQDLTPRERMAQIWGRSETRTLRDTSLLTDEQPGVETAMLDMLSQLNQGWTREDRIGRRALAGVATMLRCPDLDDAVAMAMARRLAGALGAPIADGGDRASVQNALEHAVLERDPGRDEAWVAAFGVCTELATRQPAAPALANLADCVAWNTARLNLLARYPRFEQDADRLRRFHEQVPGELGVLRAWLEHLDEDKPDKQVQKIRSEAIAASDPDRVPSLTIMRVAVPCPAQVAGPALARIAAQLRRDRHFAADLGELARGLARANRTGEANDLLVAAAEADPWNVALAESARLWTGRQDEPHPVAAPTYHWVDATIDRQQLPWTPMRERTGIMIRWTGSLRIATAGAYGLAIAGNDASRLVVGDWCIDHPGYTRLVPRCGTRTLAAGDHPLRAWYYKFQNAGGGCRLLWMPPGSKNWVPIPASALVHDAGQPGLLAEGWVDVRQGQAITPPGPALLGLARTCPWLGAALLACETAWMRDDDRTARDIFPVAEPYGSRDRVERLRLAMALLAEPPDRQLVARLLEDAQGFPYQTTPDSFREDYFDDQDTQVPQQTARLVSLGLAKEGLAALNRSWACKSQVAYVGCRLALASGDLRTALAYYRKSCEGGHYHCSCEEWNAMRLEAAILNRMVSERELDWDAFAKRVDGQIMSRPATVVLGVRIAAGRIGEAELEQCLAAQGLDALIYRGLLRYSLGDHAGARADFARLAAAGTSREAMTARDMLAWYAKAKPEELDALPRARPLPVPPPPQQSDF